MNATVLLVEDEPAFRRSLKAFLEDSGYRVLEAANGAEGLALLQRQRPDLVLTDLRMPVMDGMDLLARLRATHPTLPVLVITGTGDPKALAEAARQGAFACFMKPLTDMNDLGRSLELALARNHP